MHKVPRYVKTEPFKVQWPVPFYYSEQEIDLLKAMGITLHSTDGCCNTATISNKEVFDALVCANEDFNVVYPSFIHSLFWDALRQIKADLKTENDPCFDL